MSIKISQLPAGGAVTGTELVPAVQGGVTVSLTAAQLEAFTALGLATSAVDSGAANAYVLTSPRVPVSLQPGQIISFNPQHPSTGASTANFDGSGAIAIVDSAGNALTGGEITGPTILVWTGAVYQLLWSLPLVNKKTPQEITAGVTVVNPFQLPGYVLRYGTNTTPGTTNMTAATNAAIAQANAGGADIVFSGGGSFLVGNLNIITGNQVTVKCIDQGTQVLAASTAWSVANTVLMEITGSRCKLEYLVLNGNQAAFGAQPTGALLFRPGNDIVANGCTFINSPGHCVQTVLGASGGKWVNCHFDNNAGLGWNFWGCTYMEFSQCTFNFNGYGFNKTFATNLFVAFGIAIRYRSHHLTFTACKALQNGRDGFNVNQGSYGIKFSQCLAWMNDDGGFTLAADNTGTGFPGESESPYDCEYEDCEAYNNWSSGIAMYVPCYNMTVKNGRYYNNNRIAGQQAQASSFVCGIYIAAGSLGVVIKTKAYDDRQFCVITANSGSPTIVLTATGWVAGSATNYPRVALYSPAVTGPGLTFQGYGTIVAESAGSVSIQTTAFNGVTIGSIANGWYVSQRVQHNGVFFDNSCTGVADIDGFGQLPGAQPYFGFKTVSGYFAANQNVLLPAAQLDADELLVNPTFDTAITGWTFSTPGGGGVSLFTTAGPFLRSVGDVQLIAGSSNAIGQSSLITGASNYLNLGAWLEASIWAYAVLPGQASFALVWGAGALNSSVTHPGGGWRQLRIGAYVGPGNAASTLLQITVVTGITCYFDTASLRVRNDTYDNRDFSYPTRNLPL